MSRDRLRVWICLALVTSAGCSKTRTVPPELRDYPVPSLDPSGRMVVEVGMLGFTTGELQRRLDKMSPFARAQHVDQEQLLAWVENEARFEAVAQRAWAEGLQREPEILDRIRGVLVEEYTRRALAESIRDTEPSEAELIAAYERRRVEFNQPERVRLSHIVRYVGTPADRKKARALLERVRAEVIDGQKTNDHIRFAKAAREHSDDEATRLGGGDLPFLTKEELTARYGDAVAAESFERASVGDLYVADADNAVVLLKKTGVRRAVTRTLAEVRPNLRNQIMGSRREKAVTEWGREMLRRSGVDIDKEALSELRVDDAGR